MSSSRITGGEFRGREVLSPKNPATHPMSSRARLGLFNSLGSLMKMAGAEVLDMYAGSGALGFEALSRGADHVVFVEKDRNAAKTIEETAKKLGVLDRVEIIRRNVRRVDLQGRHFDLILVDPPYDKFRVNEWAGLCGAAPEKCVLAVSHPPMPFAGPSLFVVSDKRYSGCQIAIFKYPSQEKMMRLQKKMLKKMGIC